MMSWGRGFYGDVGGLGMFFVTGTWVYCRNVNANIGDVPLIIYLKIDKKRGKSV